MKNISKQKTTNFKVEWMVKVDGKDVEKSKVVSGVKVEISAPEVNDFASWFGTDEHGEMSPEYANHRAQVEYLVASQLLQHQGSGHFKSLALKHARDGAEFPSGVYRHDFSKKLGERTGMVDESALRAKMGKLLGVEISDEMWQKMQDAAKAPAEETEEEVSE